MRTPARTSNLRSGTSQPHARIVLSRCAAVQPTSTGTARLNGRAAHYSHGRALTLVFAEAALRSFVFFETNSAARGARWRPTPWALDVGVFAPESPTPPVQKVDLFSRDGPHTAPRARQELRLGRHDTQLSYITWLKRFTHTCRWYTAPEPLNFTV